jgi:multidrug efflux pump subunit AcrB
VLGGRTEISTWIGEVGRTIIFALACSLLLSLTAIPLVMGRFLRAGVGPQAGLLTRLADCTSACSNGRSATGPRPPASRC